MYNPTVARLTYRAVLGKRRAAILFVLPALLLLIAPRAFGELREAVRGARGAPQPPKVPSLISTDES